MSHSVRRFARGTASKLATYTPPTGEPIVDVTNWTLRVGDGRTPGGFIVGPIRSESISVMNYGAVGDGVADDTVAFESAQAAAKGRGVYVPPGKYNVTRNIPGYFWSDGSVVIPFTRVWTDGYYDFAPRDFGIGTPASIGGDSINLGGNRVVGESDRASQQGCCDILDSVFYIPQEASNHQTWIRAIKWSENESKRVLLGDSAPSYDSVAHQSLSVYRPTLADAPVFISAGNRYTSAADTSISADKAFSICFWSYDYKQGQVAPTLLNKGAAFSSAEVSSLGLDPNTLMGVYASPDGAVLVASAYSSTQAKRYTRVWDLHAIMTGKISYNNLSSSAMYTWSDAPDVSNAGGQGIWCDGRYIYFLSGASAQASFSSTMPAGIIVTYTLDGRYLGYNLIDVTYALTADATGSRASTFGNKETRSEFEGIFLAPWYGKLVPVLLNSVQRMNKVTARDSNGVPTAWDDPDNYSYRRFNRFLIPSECNFSSMMTVTRNLVLEGEIYVAAPHTFAPEDHKMNSSRIMTYMPSGAGGQVNVAFGGVQETFLVAGEFESTLRAAFQTASQAGTPVGAERVTIVSDGTICMHAGASAETDVFQANGPFNGMHLNAAGNWFFRQGTGNTGSGPLLMFQYSGMTKGQVPAGNRYSRLTWAADMGLTANTAAALAGIEHYYYATNSTAATDSLQHFTMYLYNAKNTGTNAATDRVAGLSLMQLANGSYVAKSQMNFVPWNDSTYSLGTKEQKWKYLYVDQIGVADVGPNIYTHNLHVLANIYIHKGSNIGESDPNKRPDHVYADTFVGTLDNGSDERMKQQVEALSAIEKRVALRCKDLIRKFKYNNEVDEYGDAAPIRVGIIAQDVKKAFELDGLDATKYRIINYDTSSGMYSLSYIDLLCFIISAM